MTHICVGKLTIIGSDNGLSPGRRQAIIWTNAGLLLIGPLQTYFSENLIKIQQFSLTKMHVKMSSAKWRPSCLGLNVLKPSPRVGFLRQNTLANSRGVLASKDSPSGWVFNQPRCFGSFSANVNTIACASYIYCLATLRWCCSAMHVNRDSTSLKLLLNDLDWTGQTI